MASMPLNIGLVAAATIVVGTATQAQGSQQNRATLRKAGNAVQYAVRKDVNNLSIDTHRALRRNSVECRRLPHGRRRNVVVTPKGQLKPVQPQ